MDLTITVSGLHGTGKSTYAKNVAQTFSLHYISAGEIFRQTATERKLSITELSREAEESEEIDRLIDERTKGEIEKGGVVVDALLAAWIAKDYPTLKIYLSASFETRVKRIASRDMVPYSEAKEVTTVREGIERRRFKKLYGIDLDDLSIYDLVLNTDLLPIESNIEIINTFVRGYIKSRGGKKNVIS